MAADLIVAPEAEQDYLPLATTDMKASDSVWVRSS